MTSRQPALSVEELRLAVDAGTIDTVVLAIVDMQGRLQGKRLHAEFFLDEVLRHATEGCNYLLAVDVDMNTVGRVRDVELGARVRRLRDGARPVHAAPGAVAARHGDAAGRPDLAGRDPGGGLAAADPAPSARPAGRARAVRVRRHRAGVRRLPGLVRGRLAARLPRPPPGQSVQCGLLDARHGAGRAVAAPHPRRDGRGRAAAGEREGRVQPRPARDRVPVRRGVDHIGQPRDLQAGGQGDRRPGGDGADLHGQAEPARGQLLPHPLLAARRRRPAGDGGGRRWAVGDRRAGAGRAAGHDARADPAVRAERQLVQAVPAGHVRADGGAVGGGQPDLRAAAGRARPVAAGGEPGAGWRRQPVPGGRRR